MVWISTVDPNTGRTYYANPATGESSWTPPLGLLVGGGGGGDPTVRPSPTQYHQPTTTTTITNDDDNERHHHHHQQQQQCNNHVQFGSVSDERQPQQHPLSLQHQQSPPFDADGPPIAPDSFATTAASANNSSSIINMTPKQEIAFLTAGQLADACFAQQEQQHQQQLSDSNKQLFVPYTPLVAVATEPGSIHHNRPTQEAGRLQTRLHLLSEQWKRL